ncbi:hypothetical protein NQ318_021250 [Aromia moschata]|uniref:Uncharacterized protein n=1 Tax=Aromia moschata TaxID=1265417 RepID=A0AAV8ZCJ7_9CUCU|nr:hypothetical protein NQ318_021250 [Aromia moschata]
MFSISKLIVIMCLYNGLAAVDYLQCTENKINFSTRLRCHNISQTPTADYYTLGNMVEGSVYYAKYFEQIKAVLLEFNPNEAVVIKESQTKLKDTC